MKYHNTPPFFRLCNIYCSVVPHKAFIKQLCYKKRAYINTDGDSSYGIT